jgi:hypothetical protein
MRGPFRSDEQVPDDGCKEPGPGSRKSAPFWKRIEFRSWREIRSTLIFMACAGLAFFGFQEVGLCAGLFVVLGAAVVVELVFERTRAEALRAYRDGLARLAADPGNPNLRREVLALGLCYVKVSCDLGGRGGYSEQAVRRDIAAVTGRSD